MGGYIILYDHKRKVSIRTTSNSVAEKLQKENKKLLSLAYVDGKNVMVSSGLDIKSLNVPEYNKLLEEEKGKKENENF